MNAHFEAARQLFLEGTSALEQGDLETAELKLAECLRLIPDRESTKRNLAIVHAAKAQAVAAHGLSVEAIALYDRALALSPEQPDIWINRASLLNALGRHEEALFSCDQAIDRGADMAEAWINRGNALNELGRHEEALASSDRAIAVNPDFAEAWINRGHALNELKRHELALSAFDRAIQLRPDYAEVWNNRGQALNGLRRHQEALSDLDRALKAKRDYPEAWSNRGATLRVLKRSKEALSSFQEALRLKPGLAEAWTNRGNALNDLKRHQEALDCHDEALRLRPGFAKAWGNRGQVLNDLKRPEDALESYQRALAIDPAMDFIPGDLVHTQVKVCDWTDLGSRLNTLAQGLAAGRKLSAPFAVLGALDAPELQKIAAEIYVKELGLVEATSLPAQARSHDRIRIGYFSMDFREHPVSALVVEMLERHDRSRFEIYALSFGVSSSDPMRTRLEKAVDKFIDVKDLSDPELVQLSRSLQIDIAIDLAGHTHSSRPRIFMERVAPLQINYIGFPGTWGSDCMDYIIGDRVAVTEKSKPHFSEKIIFMPDQFQVNPSVRPAPRALISRATYGLANEAFVYCCFNNSWKIIPEVFERWMRILRAVPHGVLWIYADNATSAANLRVEAAKHGVSPDRLIFAGRVPIDEYLARFACGDLFLDTLPYNAGTTASDALWAGLPVLTQAGESFAARMAASLLQGIGLPELITESGAAYESLAIELARRPQQLATLKRRLIDNRSSASLFDTGRFTRHIESAFQAIYDRHRAGLPPDHIDVEPIVC